MLGAVIFTAALLCLGVALRSRFRIFTTARIPASLLAGSIGLVISQILAWGFWPVVEPGPVIGSPSVIESLYRDAMTNLRVWPTWLIAVVFAGMLLSKSPPRAGQRRQNAEKVGDGPNYLDDRSAGFSPIAREALMVWIIAIGQTAVGLLLVWCWIGPQFGLPASAGMLIETGFAGGHGTAAAMGTVLAHPSIGMDTGLDLAVLMATSGLLYGLVSGIVWIEVGVRRGWVASARGRDVSPSTAEDESLEKADELSLDAHRISGQHLPLPSADSIDPLLLQLLWLTLALAVGVGLQFAVDQVAVFVDGSGWLVNTAADVAPDERTGLLRDRLRVASVVGSFPLFIYTLFGGAIVRFCILKTAGEHWIDHQIIQRLVGSSMDLLVVAAVATLNLAVVASLWAPMLGLFLGGSIWSTFCLLVLSRKILPEGHWFELGLINFGMSTGTTATGFVLLRVVDPDLETPAAKQYALAAPLSAPFVGGGMITVGLPLLVLERVPIAASALGMSALVVGLVVWGVSWKSRLIAVAASANAKTRS